MNVRTETAADRRRTNEPGTTASGLASATQLVDVTPFTTLTIGQSAVAEPLVVIKRATAPADARQRLHLTADEDPVLAQLWDNDDDAIYDSM